MPQQEQSKDEIMEELDRMAASLDARADIFEEHTKEMLDDLSKDIDMLEEAGSQFRTHMVEFEREHEDELEKSALQYLG